MFRIMLLLFAGNASNGIILLLRNLLVARLISVEDYGIAMTFTMAFAVIEMTSAIGLQKQLIQAENGNDAYFQAALQGFQVLRGAFNFVLLLLLAGPFAEFLGVPQVTWAHQIIAIVLLMNGFLHFDADRLNRRLRFGPAMLIASVPPLVSLAVTWPLAWYFGDYRVMLWALIAQSAAVLIATHLVAERPYRIVFDCKVMRESMRFGWPLLLDGLLVFMIFNGEKLIVGRTLGMENLALFTMAVTLTLTPGLVFMRIAQNFFLPQLAATRDEGSFFDMSHVTIQAHLACGGFLVLGVTLLGAPFIHLALGAKYEGAVPLLALLGVMQALYTFKGAPTVIAIARAKTSNAMISNLVRVAALPLTWIVAAWSGNVVTVIVIGIVAQFLSYVASMVLLRRQVGLPLRPSLAPLLVSFAVLACVPLTLINDPVPAAVAQLCMAGLFGLSVVTMRDLRAYLGARRMIRQDD